MIFDKIHKGWALGEFTVTSAGRQTGKSNYTMTMLKRRQPLKPFTLLSSRVEDAGMIWRTVEISVLDVEYWMLEQDASMYSELMPTQTFSQYEIHEQLFTMMALRWS